jgi:hypothetical protein
MKIQHDDLRSAQQVPAFDLEQLKTVANAVHLAALNLAMTYGVFQGINSAPTRPVISSDVIKAINFIQHDLLHLMAIRLCALCDDGQRPDDASIVLLSRRITPEIRRQLITNDKQWRAAIGARAQRVTDVARSISNLRRQQSALRSQGASLKKVRRFRDKLIAHVTVGHRASNRVELGELWKLTRTTLAAARSARLIFERLDQNYLKEARIAKRYGSELARAVLATR